MIINNELVSVCVPTYNGGKFLKEALLSVNDQSYQHIEIIISDDQSTDETLRIINDFSAISKFPVKVYHHTPNGIAGNWNHCIQKSNGEYIKFLFQDDVMAKDCVEKMIVAFNNISNTGLIACKRNILVDTDFNHSYAQNWISAFGDLQKGIETTENGTILSRTFFKSRQFLSSPVNKVGEPSLYFFRRSLVSEIGFFSSKYNQLLDYEFCIRVIKHYNIVILNEKLVDFRLHGSQATQLNISKEKETERFKRMLFRKYFLLLGYRNMKQLFFDFEPIGKFLIRSFSSIGLHSKK